MFSVYGKLVTAYVKIKKMWWNLSVGKMWVGKCIISEAYVTVKSMEFVQQEFDVVKFN